MALELQWLQLQQREVQTGMLDLLRRNLGHELRNPMGGIRGAAQMLDAELHDKELGTLARLIMREVDRIEELIRRFGQPRLSHSKADLHQVIDEAVDLLQAESGGRVGIERDYDPSIPPLPGDASALRQVVLNLVRNAQQAGAQNIRLRTRVEHGAALLQAGQGMLARADVEDDGEGVPEELRALLFLPLVTGRRDGTGLGLAMAQQIAAAHSGLLSYEALDQGSRFSLRLPLNEQPLVAEPVHG
jgi:two-component system nitrogen regulation sensor histidine kinase GlnL